METEILAVMEDPGNSRVDCEELAGYRSGKLTAIGPTTQRKNEQVVWLCACDCGGMSLVRRWNLVKENSTKQCGQCSHKGYGFVARMYSRAKARAKQKDLPFDLKIYDIEVPDVCPVLGIEIEPQDDRKGPNSPSLDRVIPSRGYVKDNIRVISSRANWLKHDGTPEELQAVADYAREAVAEVKNADRQALPADS